MTVNENNEPKSKDGSNSGESTWGPKLFLVTAALVLFFFWWLLIYSGGVAGHH